jgi:hypothetical protein
VPSMSITTELYCVAEEHSQSNSSRS